MELSKEYILECLEKYCDLGEHLSEYSFYNDIVAPLLQAGCFPGMDYANGVTKGVLIFPNCNFVIKIPFYGNEECEEYTDGLTYEEAMEKYGEDWSDRPKEYYLDPFYGAQGRHNSWDYCAVEAELYAEAVTEGLEFLFAETQCIGTANGWPIYAQTRVEIFAFADPEDENRDFPSEQELEQADNLRGQKDSLYCSKVWIAELIRAYDLDTYHCLSAFCERFNIGDFHDENIGYLNSLPVLVDYSSYDN